jgi:hypothetical protein
VRKARRAAARRGRRLRIMFTDEARFGRMNRIRPCWAPIGTRPAVAAQLIREYIYLYGSGETVGNADCRNGRHRLIVNPVAVTNGEAVLGAVPPDCTLHKPRKRCGKGRIKLPSVNVGLEADQ